jgi:membrane protein DedA with SNARE-associated domain/rhodanese-related sulfurtransferase
MGALVGEHVYSFWTALAIATCAALIGDYIWYELGRFRGRGILNLVCRVSLEPDTCVRKTELAFSKRGAGALIFAKFVPGMGLISMPLAGLVGMPRWQFLLADIAGASLWATSYLLLGFMFHKQVDATIIYIGLLGRRAGLVAALLVAAYIAYKYLQRRKFARELRINRITPAALYELITSGARVTVVDLRSPLEVQRDGTKLAGALVLVPNDLQARAKEIAGHSSEVVLYCTCPNEATSARVAMQLRRAGVRRVRPLEGGLDAWRASGYPIEPVSVSEEDATLLR